MTQWIESRGDTVWLFFFLAALNGFWDLSSLTRGWTQALAVKVPSPNHWAAREFQHWLLRLANQKWDNFHMTLLGHIPVEPNALLWGSPSHWDESCVAILANSPSWGSRQEPVPTTRYMNVIPVLSTIWSGMREVEWESHPAEPRESPEP